MKKLLLIMLLTTSYAGYSQKVKDMNQLVYNLQMENDSLKRVSAAYADTADRFFSAILKFKDAADASELRAQANKALSDSLQSKINKMLIFHFYACSILENIATDGTIVRRSRFVEAVKNYNKYYKE